MVPVIFAFLLCVKVNPGIALRAKGNHVIAGIYPWAGGIMRVNALNRLRVESCRNQQDESE